MPHYKRQHYLPAAYLKYFSADQQKCNRDSILWRFDGQNLLQVSVVSQCFGNYFYSKEKAVETEQTFQRSEKLYCECIEKIKSKEPLTNQNYGSLFYAMLDLHIRNAAHKNLTGKEGVDAYKLRSEILMGQILLGRENGEVTTKEILAHIAQNWSVEILSVPPGSMFIASDHPSVWTVVNGPTRPDLHIVTLPLTPNHTAIAFNRRVLQVISDKINLEDQKTLNMSQIENAKNCIYSSLPFTNEQMVSIKDHFSRKANLPSEVHPTGWQMYLQGLPTEYHFSFIRLNPPLF